MIEKKSSVSPQLARTLGWSPGLGQTGWPGWPGWHVFFGEGWTKPSLPAFTFPNIIIRTVLIILTRAHGTHRSFQRLFLSTVSHEWQFFFFKYFFKRSRTKTKHLERPGDIEATQQANTEANTTRLSGIQDISYQVPRLGLSSLDSVS